MHEIGINLEDSIYLSATIRLIQNPESQLKQTCWSSMEFQKKKLQNWNATIKWLTVTRTFLLLYFQVLHKIITGTPCEASQSRLGTSEEFDPNVSDDLSQSSPVKSPGKGVQFQKAVTLCAETVLAHLVNHLGHFPMAIGAARLSSMVAEHDDVPNLSSDDLSNVIFSVPNIQVSSTRVVGLWGPA